MENVTETQEVVTTPAENVDVDTSTQDVPADADNTSVEPTETEVTAETTQETETSENEKLYAGKFKSVEDLEKSYEEVQKFVGKSNEFEKKYNELLSQQTKAQEQKKLEELTQAQQRGFDSVEEQKIADKVTLAEFNYYWQAQNTVQPEYAQEVNQALQQYYATGNKAYLEKAKTFFSSDFIENVAVAKSNYANNLRNQYSTERQEAMNKAQQELATQIQTNFAEFLGDIKENEGKSEALRIFCNVGSIQSVDDMRTFENIYAKIAKHERELAIKELNAQKSIEETKEKAVVPAAATSQPDVDSNLPTRAELVANPKLYEKAVKKWGMEKIDGIIMKG